MTDSPLTPELRLAAIDAAIAAITRAATGLAAASRLLDALDPPAAGLALAVLSTDLRTAATTLRRCRDELGGAHVAARSR